MLNEHALSDIAALRSGLDRHRDDAIELRHRLHANPTISGHEAPTAQLLARELGAEDSTDIAGGRIIVSGDSDSYVALRAELDALPIIEQTNVEWRSTNGAMHACGHDVHLAALVATFRTLQDAGMPVAAILQPREESVPGGAADMIATGALTEYRIGSVIGVHVQPQIPLGSFSSAPGVVNAASDEFTIVIQGQGGHGAYPHTTRDPITAAASVINALQHVVSRAISPMNPTVVGVGSIHGGSAANAVPDDVTLTGTVRSYDQADRIKLPELIENAARSAAGIHGCDITLQYRYGEPPLSNDPDLSLRQSTWATAWGLSSGQDIRSCGSDDFAFFGQEVPSVMSFIGVGDGSPGSPGLHSSTFLPPDSVIADTALLMLAGYVAAVEGVESLPSSQTVPSRAN